MGVQAALWDIGFIFGAVEVITNLPAMQETRVQLLGGADLLEKEMASHSSILAWRIPWTEEEPGVPQSMGSQTVGQDWVTITLEVIMFAQEQCWDFPDSSAGKESACNAGDPSSVPGSERSAGEGIGYPLQYSWASLVAQLVKNIPAMQEHWVQFLGREDLLEKGKATHSSILAWRIPWTV